MEHIYDLEGCKRVWKEIPHIAPEVNTFLEKYLTKDREVFEWGSGGSTIWIAKRVKHIYSVEVADAWYQFLTEKIVEFDLKNVTLYHYPIGADGIIQNIYYDIIMKLKRKFPLIIVDGVVFTRNICFEIATKCLAKDGYIIFDDFQHPGFNPTREILKKDNWGVNYYSKANGNLTGLIHKL